jgi:hypothetical protein
VSAEAKSIASDTHISFLKSADVFYCVLLVMVNLFKIQYYNIVCTLAQLRTVADMVNFSKITFSELTTLIVHIVPK